MPAISGPMLDKVAGYQILGQGVRKKQFLTFTKNFHNIQNFIQYATSKIKADLQHVALRWQATFFVKQRLVFVFVFVFVFAFVFVFLGRPGCRAPPERLFH